jgi:hypothetical protein
MSLHSTTHGAAAKDISTEITIACQERENRQSSKSSAHLKQTHRQKTTSQSEDSFSTAQRSLQHIAGHATVAEENGV